MRKLIAVLVLSIAITGMGYAPPEPLEPPVVSIGEQPLADVAMVLSVSVERSHALVITMEQSAVTTANPALVDLGIFDARYHNGRATDCSLHSGTNLPLLSMKEPDTKTDGQSPICKYRRNDATAGETDVPEVAGLLPCRLSVAGVRLL